MHIDADIASAARDDQRAKRRARNRIVDPDAKTPDEDQVWVVYVWHAERWHLLAFDIRPAYRKIRAKTLKRFRRKLRRDGIPLPAPLYVSPLEIAQRHPPTRGPDALQYDARYRQWLRLIKPSRTEDTTHGRTATAQAELADARARDRQHTPGAAIRRHPLVASAQRAPALALPPSGTESDADLARTLGARGDRPADQRGTRAAGSSSAFVKVLDRPAVVIPRQEPKRPLWRPQWLGTGSVVHRVPALDGTCPTDPKGLGVTWSDLADRQTQGWVAHNTAWRPAAKGVNVRFLGAPKDASVSTTDTKRQRAWYLALNQSSSPETNMSATTKKSTKPSKKSTTTKPDSDGVRKNALSLTVANTLTDLKIKHPAIASLAAGTAVSKDALTKLRDHINAVAIKAREAGKDSYATKLSGANRLVRRLARRA